MPVSSRLAWGSCVGGKRIEVCQYCNMIQVTSWSVQLPSHVMVVIGFFIDPVVDGMGSCGVGGVTGGWLPLIWCFFWLAGRPPLINVDGSMAWEGVGIDLPFFRGASLVCYSIDGPLSFSFLHVTLKCILRRPAWSHARSHHGQFISLSLTLSQLPFLDKNPRSISPMFPLSVDNDF